MSCSVKLIAIVVRVGSTAVNTAESSKNRSNAEFGRLPRKYVISANNSRSNPSNMNRAPEGSCKGPGFRVQGKP